MLDQNTDRMWYVIGALVVGAGIILLANKAMPEVFASVADSFEGVSEDATSVIDDIKIRYNVLNRANETPNSFLYDSKSTLVPKIEGLSNPYGGTIHPVHGSMGHATSEIIEVFPGETLYFVKDAGLGDRYWRMTLMDGDRNYHSRRVSTANERNFVVPEGIHFIRVSYPSNDNPRIYVER